MTDLSRSHIDGLTSKLNEASPAELLTNLREKIHQIKLLEKSNAEINQMLQMGKTDDENESRALDQDDKVVLKEALEENKEAIERKKQASQIFCDTLLKQMGSTELPKDLTLEIQSTIRELQGSSIEQDQIDSSATNNQGIFM